MEPIFLLVISVLIALSILTKAWSKRYFRLPPVVGFIGLGFVLRAIDARWSFMIEQAEWTLEFLANVGVAALLFRVGLRSDIEGLRRQLPRASWVWIWNVAISAGLGFAVARLLDWGPIPAAFVAVAMSATSVGISVSVWEDAKLMRSRLGELMLDVAELDDLSAVMLMLAVFAAAPLIVEHGAGEATRAALGAVAWMLVKVAAFAVGCWIFAKYLEPPLSRFLARTENPPERVVTILAVGFGVAAIAGWIGFSIAVGALFAGLTFSRDREAVHEQKHMEPLYAFFTPFFFIDIGFALDPGALGSSLLLGLVLFVPAVLGKVVGSGLPILKASGLRSGLLLGVSMVPRAEIGLLVARSANRLGDWAISHAMYGALVVAFGLTATAAPIVLAVLLKRWPSAAEPHEESPDEDP